MKPQGPRKSDEQISRSMRIAFTPHEWERIEKEASGNRRAISSEIAVRVLDSIQEERV